LDQVRNTPTVRRASPSGLGWTSQSIVLMHVLTVFDSSNEFHSLRIFRRFRLPFCEETIRLQHGQGKWYVRFEILFSGSTIAPSAGSATTTSLLHGTRVGVWGGVDRPVVGGLPGGSVGFRSDACRDERRSLQVSLGLFGWCRLRGPFGSRNEACVLLRVLSHIACKVFTFKQPRQWRAVTCLRAKHIKETNHDVARPSQMVRP
jgi:hypothetical protein